ncbi:MAG: Spy/CpxP family protein refolding chaperone [Pseudomonadota bacterium]
MAHTARTPFSAGRLFGTALLVAVLGSVALSAWAQGGYGGHGGHRGGMGMPMQGRMVERMLDSVNATAEQRTQIKQITERAATERRAQFESGRALREQSLKVFTQPVVDANAAEALRQQMLQQHDQASRRTMQTMLEVSRVLTPEQRKLLADRMAKRGEMMKRHMQERQSIEGAPAKR